MCYFFSKYKNKKKKIVLTEENQIDINNFFIKIFFFMFLMRNKKKNLFQCLIKSTTRFYFSLPTFSFIYTKQKSYSKIFISL